MLALLSVSPNLVLWDDVNTHPKVPLPICTVQFNVKFVSCAFTLASLGTHKFKTSLRLSYRKLERKRW